MNVVALRHQNNSINILRYYPKLPNVFLIGGFGAGKSMTDVILLMYFINEYYYSEEHVNIGVFGVTIKLLKQTVIADLLRFMDGAGMTYKHNSQAGTIEVGNVSIIYLQMQNPDDIYAFNFHFALCDEIDEVPAEKVKPIVTAIRERCRKVVPAGKTMPQRSPFIFFSTTAQGLGGTYRLVEDFKATGVPYAIIRARTEDNPHIDKQQLEILRKMYTPDEAAAYLDGKFMNLSTGRVWHSFDRRKNVCMRFPILPTDHVYVGQDFNLGINASCEFIHRGNIIYVIASHHWPDMGVAARVLRERYPTNPITLIPDSSGKEIMQGFAEAFEKQHIEIFWNGRNPGIQERTMAGNMLFRQGLCYVMQDDKVATASSDKYSELMNEGTGDVAGAIMCLETHDIDEKTGKPRKGVGIHSPDHFSDSFGYGTWHLIHQIEGYTDILTALKGVNHEVYEAA